LKQFLKNKFIIRFRGSLTGLVLTKFFRPKKYIEIRKKWAVIKEFQQKYNLDVFVETGTYLGETLRGIRGYFQEVYSLELDQILFESAVKNFSLFDNIKFFQGDSAKTLPTVLKLFNKRTIFWLDAHASGGITAHGEKVTPVEGELLAIKNHPIKNHIILIDDAESFVGRNDYPAIAQIKSILQEINSDYKLEIKDNIIRIYF
jgi:hypothetical protein